MHTSPQRPVRAASLILFHPHTFARLVVEPIRHSTICIDQTFPLIIVSTGTPIGVSTHPALPTHGGFGTAAVFHAKKSSSPPTPAQTVPRNPPAHQLPHKRSRESYLIHPHTYPPTHFTRPALPLHFLPGTDRSVAHGGGVGTRALARSGNTHTLRYIHMIIQVQICISLLDTVTPAYLPRKCGV